MKRSFAFFLSKMITDNHYAINLTTIIIIILCRSLKGGQDEKSLCICLK